MEMNRNGQERKRRKNGNCVFLTAENAYEIRVLRMGQKKRAKIGNAIHKQK